MSDARPVEHEKDQKAGDEKTRKKGERELGASGGGGGEFARRGGQKYIKKKKEITYSFAGFLLDFVFLPLNRLSACLSV